MVGGVNPDGCLDEVDEGRSHCLEARENRRALVACESERGLAMSTFILIDWLRFRHLIAWHDSVVSKSFRTNART